MSGRFQLKADFNIRTSHWQKQISRLNFLGRKIRVPNPCSLGPEVRGKTKLRCSLKLLPPSLRKVALPCLSHPRGICSHGETSRCPRGRAGRPSRWHWIRPVRKPGWSHTSRAEGSECSSLRHTLLPSSVTANSTEAPSVSFVCAQGPSAREMLTFQGAGGGDEGALCITIFADFFGSL